MPETTSIFAFALGVLVTAVPMWVLRRPAAKTAELVYLEKHAVRFALAQHWARGALLSDPSEPWRPIVSAAAIAAAAVEDAEALVRLINQITGSVSVTSDPQTANVWRQVQAELVACRLVLPYELLAGVRADGLPSWSHQAITTRTVELIEQSTERAALLVRARSIPPPSSPPS